MENASKALIIAGAILLSILIISLGIIVVRNATGTINNANLDQEEVSTFNSKYTAYMGNGKRASVVNTLIEAVNANNALDKDKQIEIVLSGLTANTHYTGTADATNKKYNYVMSNSYTYKLTYDTAASGIINKITITV